MSVSRSDQQLVRSGVTRSTRERAQGEASVVREHDGPVLSDGEHQAAVAGARPTVPSLPAARTGSADGPVVSPAVNAARLMPEAAAEGFRVDTGDGRNYLLHDCGNFLEISPAVTGAQLGWCVTAHRCGPPGSQWHIGVTPESDRWNPGTSSAHLARGRQVVRRRQPAAAGIYVRPAQPVGARLSGRRRGPEGVA